MTAPAPRERALTVPGPLVRAILTGERTQVTVPMTSARWWRHVAFIAGRGMDADAPQHYGFQDGEGVWWLLGNAYAPDNERDLPCPLGDVGDRLYLRETWKPLGYGPGFGVELHYRADGHDPSGPQRTTYRRILDPCPDRDDRFRPTSFGPWRSATQMPRWASRRTLTIATVREGRLHDVTDADVRAEGWTRDSVESLIRSLPGRGLANGLQMRMWREFNRTAPWVDGPAPRELYRVAWTALHGAESWDANPWRWTVGFTVAKGATS